MKEGELVTEKKPVLPGRLTSLDAYRGLVLFLMMGEVLPGRVWP